MSETRKSPWGGEQRVAFPQINEVAPAPDGRQVAYVVREPLLRDDKSEYVSQIYLASLDGGEPSQLTFGEARTSCVRWSPDGQYLAFLSTRSGKANIYVLRVAGGEAWPLTRYEKSAVSSFHWSPDGTQFAFLMAEPPSDEREQAVKARDDAERFGYDFDFPHLFLVPFAVGPRQLPAVTQLTQGRMTVIGFDWFPDGQRLAITHRPSPTADDWMLTRLGVLPLAGGEPQDVALISDWGAAPRVSPNGRFIACVTAEQPASWAYASRVGIYSLDGEEMRTLAVTPDNQPSLIGWSPNSDAVYVDEFIGTATNTLVLPLSGEPARPIEVDPPTKFGAQCNRQGQIAFIGQNWHEHNGVYLLDINTGVAQLVARPPLPTSWPAEALPQAEVTQWRAPDGLTIEGILVYPQGYQQGKRYPLVVSVHGGPTGVFSRSYLAQPGGYCNIAELTDRGYAILLPNPRGSSGYGRSFRFANQRDWGGGDFQDIMAGVDHLIERGVADAERLGIMGWSYGGFMTSWAITQTRRFKAACVGAAVTDLVSFNGTSDIPGFVPDYFGGESWEHLELYRDHSPVFQVKGVTTPTLIQHGANDVRVPLSQGREFYNALRRQGVEVELIVYPRQGHILEEPRLTLDLRRRAVEWLERHL